VAANCLDCRSCLNIGPDVDGMVYCAKRRGHVRPSAAETCAFMRRRR